MVDNTLKAKLALDTFNRNHSIDSLRVFLVVIVVIFHVAQSFGYNSVFYWVIADNSPSLPLVWFRFISHSFMMPLFFLISGFSAEPLLQKLGVVGFTRNRIKRVLVPFIVSWLLIYPLVVFLSLVGASKSGYWDALGVPFALRSIPPWQLTIGFFLKLQVLQKFSFIHLWFLYQLLVLYVLTLLTFFISQWLGSKQNKYFLWVNWLFHRVLNSPWKLLWFAIITMPLLYLQHSRFLDTPDKALIPELSASLLYGLFFCTGWIISRQPKFLCSVSKYWSWHLMLGLLLIMPSGGYEVTTWMHLPLESYKPSYGLMRFITKGAYALMMWSFVVGFLGFFLRYRSGESVAWRYLADASYWWYLIHFPLVLGLQIWVAFWPVFWGIKFLMINLIVFSFLLFTYHYLVRSTFIGQQLNGRKYPLKSIL